MIADCQLAGGFVEQKSVNARLFGSDITACEKKGLSGVCHICSLTNSARSRRDVANEEPPRISILVIAQVFHQYRFQGQVSWAQGMRFPPGAAASEREHPHH